MVMRLKNFVAGKWVEGTAPYRDLHNPVTGQVIARASSVGVDMKSALDFARSRGGSALRAMSFAERGAMLDKIAKAINDQREALIDLAAENGGNTRKDAKFDIDGATATLAYYARQGAKLGDATYLIDGKTERLAANPRYVGQHIYTTKRGAALHINAFNFPAWGLCEKAAVSWLAGMPVVTKPATSTAVVAHRIVEILAEAKVLPDGALSLICGSAGDVLDHLNSQDVVAFTGSSGVGKLIKGHPEVIANNVSVTVEADSLNSAVLGPDVKEDSVTWDLFIDEVMTDMTQKAGQKCTATRRILVPGDSMAAVEARLVEELTSIKVGNPLLRPTRVGPLATAAQAKDICAGIESLKSAADVVFGDAPVELYELDSKEGYFVGPTLLKANGELGVINELEVFGPVATLISYDGSADKAVEICAAGGGTLVTSIYSDKREFIQEAVLGLAPHTGRVHVGGKKIADHSPGPGTVMPQMIHGGPGRAGGGEELGGLRGLSFYMQRTGVQGTAPILEKIFADGAAL